MKPRPPVVRTRAPRPPRGLFQALSEEFEVRAGKPPKMGAEADALAVRTASARALAALGLISLAGMGLTLRAALLMTVPDARLEQRADQFQGAKEEHGPRGALYDRQGRLLAYSVSLPTLYANPSAIPKADLPALLPKLAAATGRTETWLAEHFAPQKNGKPLVELRLADGLDPASVADATAGFRRDQLWVKEEPSRFYPGKAQASPLLGYIDAHGTGAAGLEKVLERDIRGDVHRRVQLQDRKGRAVDAGVDDDRVSKAGHSIRLTLDSSIQHATEAAMMRAVELSKPSAAMVVVMDVQTGAILAMANWPSANPNDNAARANHAAFTNHAAMDQIEPGSVIKPFIAAAALEEGLVKPETMVDCLNGSWTIGGKEISDDHPKSVIPVSEVIKFSSNIGAAKLGFMLGPERVMSYLKDFGFGRSTGLGLPAEVPGSLRAADVIKPIELATTAFGQGMTASPVQLVSAIATLANGGVRMQPYLVDAVLDRFGEIETVRTPQEDRQVISPETARQISEMMVLVAEEGGTGTRARVEGYLVAGKTGTAQKVANGGYGEERIGSYVGYLPALEPRIAVAVSIDSPTVGSKYGGIVAAPVFAEIGAFSMRYLGVTPDPNVHVKPPRPAFDEHGNAIAPPPAPVKPVPVETPVAVMPITVESDGGGAWIMPDLAGRTLRATLAGLEGTGLQVTLQGYGSLVAQEPLAGAKVRPGETVTLKFN